MLAAARLQWSALLWQRRTSEAQLFAHDSSPSRSKIVGVFSIARRKRNHVLRSMRRASTQEISPRSKTTTPHPPLCNSRSVVFSACSSRFHGLPFLAALRAWCPGLNSGIDGKGRGGRKPRRGGSLSRSTCSPAHRGTTCICADSVTTLCFPTIEGITFSTPRINSRGCRQPCICIGFLVSAPTPRVFPVSLPTPAKYEGVLAFGPRSPVSPHRIQSSRGRSTPAAASDNGSRESETSTNAHAC